ncbi:MAG: hypothetical protein E7394_01020 [Ruminococcaceae bacterium]|nr:hypothetical protein [Oscillospiraceae bacterium]
MSIFTLAVQTSLLLSVFHFIMSLAVSISNKNVSKKRDLKKIKICVVTTLIFFLISFACTLLMTVTEHYDVLIWIAGIVILIINRLIAKDLDHKAEIDIIQKTKAEEIREYNRKRKEDADTTTEENITPGKRRTTAQITQAAFEFKEEVRKKLEKNNYKAYEPIPDNVSIGMDGLPYIKTREYGYGKRFNAFITKNSDCYHRSKCSTIRFRKKTVMHRYTAMKIYKPCARCKPIDYVDNWYKIYLEQQKQPNKIGEKNETN